MKKKVLALLSAALFAACLFQPSAGNAESQVDKINRQLEEVRKEMKEAAASQKQAEQDKQEAMTKKSETAKSVNEIIGQINEVGTEMTGVQQQIEQKEDKLRKAGEDLQETEDRIASQDKLLQSRIRLMYTNGVVSYLDVLMSSASFSDFLDRLDSLKSILGRDEDVLAAHKRDKELLEKQKKGVESSLAEVKTMYAKLDSYQQTLQDKEKQKEVMILRYNDQIQDSEGISDEQEELLIKLAKQEADLVKKKNAIKDYYTGGKLGMPLKAKYRLSSPFGYRIHPITGVRKLHAGIDMAVPEGTPIYAAESGVVLVAQWSNGYGNCVIIDHGGGLWTVYGHIRNGGIKVKQGETVKRGQKIAEVGSTGDSTGNHLHFEVRQNEKPVNPVPFLQ